MLKNNILKCISMLFIVSACWGCATVPKESVELNQQVGKGIQESRRTHINLLNNYFVMKKARIDQWIESEYMPAYIQNIKNELKKAGEPDALNEVQWKDIMHDVISERDQRQSDLEKTRLMLIEQMDAHYDQLLRANVGITALLQSLVDVKEATKSASETIKTKTGGKIDLDAIDQKFTEYLTQIGAAAKTTTSLYEQVKQMTSK